MKKQTKTNPNQNQNMLPVTIDRIHRFDNNESKLKAYIDVTIYNSVKIPNVKIVDGSKGLFVSLPQIKTTDNRYVQTVRITSKNIRQAVHAAAMQAYQSI